MIKSEYKLPSGMLGGLAGYNTDEYVMRICNPREIKTGDWFYQATTCVAEWASEDPAENIMYDCSFNFKTPTGFIFQGGDGALVFKDDSERKDICYKIIKVKNNE